MAGQTKQMTGLAWKTSPSCSEQHQAERRTNRLLWARRQTLGEVATSGRRGATRVLPGVRKPWGTSDGGGHAGGARDPGTDGARAAGAKRTRGKPDARAATLPLPGLRGGGRVSAAGRSEGKAVRRHGRGDRAIAVVGGAHRGLAHPSASQAECQGGRRIHEMAWLEVAVAMGNTSARMVVDTAADGGNRARTSLVGGDAAGGSRGAGERDAAGAGLRRSAQELMRMQHEFGKERDPPSVSVER